MKKEKDYYKTDAAKVRNRLKETQGDRKWWKPKPNTKNIIRVLGPWGKVANGMFFFTSGLHYGFQIGGENRAVPCGKTKEVPERCLVCEFIEAIRSSNNEDLEKLITGNKNIRVKRKYWVNILDRKYPGEIKIWGASRKFIDMINETMEDNDYGDITDVENGHDIRVTRIGSGFTDTRYSFTVRPKPSPLGLEGWKKLLHKLDEEVIEWMSIAEIAKVMRDNYSDEMAEAGFKIKLKLKDSKELKKETIEEGLEDEEEELEEEEEEDEKPIKKAKKKVRMDDSDDEEDDAEELEEDDEEEDEEEEEDDDE